jgi:hydroxyacylglutathione hydrolase
MLHTLRLALPNVYLLTGERCILIDAGRPKDVPRILAFLQAHQIDKLALILLTHGHWDHAGGAAQLRAVTKAPIALHRADAELVRSGAVPPQVIRTRMAWFIHRFIDQPFPPFEPDIVVAEEMDLQRFGVDGRVMFTPGHSPGSISVLTGDNEAIVGDMIMGGLFGGWLLPSRPGLHYFADDLGQLHASIAKLLAAGPRVVYPGHGGPLDPRAVARRFSI